MRVTWYWIVATSVRGEVGRELDAWIGLGWGPGLLEKKTERDISVEIKIMVYGA